MKPEKPAASAADLLDRAFFEVDSATFSKFQALLDRPLPPNDPLRRMLRTKAPWDE